MSYNVQLNASNGRVWGRVKTLLITDVYAAVRASFVRKFGHRRAGNAGRTATYTPANFMAKLQRMFKCAPGAHDILELGTEMGVCRHRD